MSEEADADADDEVASADGSFHSAKDAASPVEDVLSEEQPEDAKPEVAKTEVAKPEVTKPEVTKPEVKKTTARAIPASGFTPPPRTSSSNDSNYDPNATRKGGDNGGAHSELISTLRRIDGKQYPGYHDIESATKGWVNESEGYSLYIARAQSDTFSRPTKCRVIVKASKAQFPPISYQNRVRNVALGDYLNRVFYKCCKDMGADIAAEDSEEHGGHGGRGYGGRGGRGGRGYGGRGGGSYNIAKGGDIDVSFYCFCSGILIDIISTFRYQKLTIPLRHFTDCQANSKCY